MKPRDILLPSEASATSASELTVRWDLALMLGASVFALVFCGSMFLAFKVGDPFIADASDALKDLLAFPQYALRSSRWHLLRVALCALVAGYAAFRVGRMTLKPGNRLRHIEGGRLLEGEEAIRAARMVLPDDAKPFVRLSPDLPLAKSQCTRHFLISGSVGSGKTQIIAPLIRQLLDSDARMIVYDVKGDFTAMSKRPLIVSPWDRRSAAWDIGADITNDESAQAFAQSIIPHAPGGQNAFFTGASQTLMVGILYKLMHAQQHEGKPWGWADLSRELLASPEQLRDDAQIYYPRAAGLIAKPDGTTTGSIMQTLSQATSFIHTLGVAWKDATQTISFKAWARDGYQGPRQIILQAGTDADLTKRYIAAIVNVIIPAVISPALPDDEQGRTLAFILDEFTSIGKLEVGPLIDKGRSKGCVVVLGYQAHEQVRELYGDNFANALAAMVGTQIVCQTGMGDTRDRVARSFGERRVRAVEINDGKSHQGEHTRPVVLPHDLTEKLGVVKGKQWRYGFAIRALVSTAGHDPMILAFPGHAIPKVRDAFQPAAWTKGIPDGTKEQREKAEAAAPELDASQLPEWIAGEAKKAAQDPMLFKRQQYEARKAALDLKELYFRP